MNDRPDPIPRWITAGLTWLAFGCLAVGAGILVAVAIIAAAGVS